jgi:hypothetical protein
MGLRGARFAATLWGAKSQLRHCPRIASAGADFILGYFRRVPPGREIASTRSASGMEPLPTAEFVHAIARAPVKIGKV